MKVTIDLEIPDQRCYDLFITAIETGIAYWMNNGQDVRNISIVRSEDEDKFYESISFEHNIDGKGWVPCTLTPISTVQLSAGIVSSRWPNHLTDFLDENEDAIIADVFFQVAAFGDIVYS